MDHRTVPARRSDPGDDRGKKAPPPPPPPPPSWRHWLIWVGLALSALLFLSTLKAGPQPVTLTYSKFLQDVSNGQVKTATIDANGGITGTLTNKKSYSSQVPEALNDTSL
ncbi:MAG TPA: ATP-dependent metallopeptidase FtsH/Yme1/Tma family protein, partial [Actinomycetota bacterium]|nr:ATP-dependent metallopeptidase FtsH/Yme1/Tma family protein [Actinomycetota bacterium]